jgi:hypothetical protein
MFKQMEDVTTFKTTVLENKEKQKKKTENSPMDHCILLNILRMY